MATSPETPDTRRLRRIADRAGVPFLALDPEAPGGVGVEESALAALDAAAARTFGVMPVKADGETLLVAIADPGDAATLAGVQALTDLQVEPAVAAAARIRDTQDTLYGEPRAERPRQAPDYIGSPPPDPAGRRGAPARARRRPRGGAALRLARADAGPRRGVARPGQPRGGAADRRRSLPQLQGDPDRRGRRGRSRSPPPTPPTGPRSPSPRCWRGCAPGWSSRRPRRSSGRSSACSARRASAPRGRTAAGDRAAAGRTARRPAAAAVEAEPAPSPGSGGLGEMLLSRGKLSDEELEEALELQRRQGDRLGEILMHTGVVPEADVSETLAEQQQLSFTDLATVEPDPETHTLIPEEIAQRYRVVPLAIVDGVLNLAMADALDEEAMAQVTEHVDMPVRAFVAPPTSVELLLQRIYAEKNAEIAAAALLLRRPEESAHKVLSRPQKIVFGGLRGLGLICLAIWPLHDDHRLQRRDDRLLHLVPALPLPPHLPQLRPRRRAAGLRRGGGGAGRADLPIYTILVPLYREAAVLPRLVDSIAELDYPPTRLDIKLLLEEDDEETLAAVRALDLPPHFKLVIVPDVGPRTKPKACNYGLTQARGEYVVIYDAEDAPEPDQLKKIVVAFAKANERVACIQCKLNYYNQRPEPADPLVHQRVLDVVRPAAAGPRRLGGADPARRHLEPLLDRAADRVRRLGPLQRRRGRRPRAAPAQVRLQDGDRRLDHLRGGDLLRPQLGPPALALGEGLHPVLAGADAPPDPPAAPDRPPALALLPVDGRRHAGDLPAQPDLLGADHGLAADRSGRDRGRLPGPRLLHLRPRAVRRQLPLRLHDRRRRGPPRLPRPGQVRAARPRLLGADVLGRLEGLHPAVHQALLLGEDGARDGRGGRSEPR